MARYRTGLPQLNGGVFITDGGLETTLIFHHGLDLPEFAAFDLLKDPEGRGRLYNYFTTYAAIARDHGVGLVLDSATWRASLDWGEKLGYSREALADMNRKAVELLYDIRAEYENGKTRIVIGGCVGPRGDGYNPRGIMSEAEAESYHSAQIEILRETEADFVSAMTMTTVEEATGIARACGSAGMPVVISFTVETDGRMPSGLTLREAVERVDEATNKGPAYYMINCAHPTHFAGALAPGEAWAERIRGIRANASTMSHAELDGAGELDDGDPSELGRRYEELVTRLPWLNVLGGCCGTDHRHIEEICRACVHGS